MLKQRGLLLIGFLLLSAILNAAEAPIILVTDGIPQAAVVLPDSPNAVETLAAEELIYHIQQASGATLPLLPESSFPGSFSSHVFIGNCRATHAAGMNPDALPASAFQIKTVDGKLFLAGKDRDRGVIGHYWNAGWQGTLYAVYELLETELGVRWLWPGKLGEQIPARANITIPPLNRQSHPRWRQAWLVPAGKKSNYLPGWSSPAAKDEFFAAQDVFLRRHRMGAVENHDYGHAFSQYWGRFHKSNPEFFALLPDGSRRPLEGNPAGSYITMCVANPDFHQQILKDWQKNPERNPERIPHRPHINACENDAPGMCCCALCRAWDAPHPGFANHPYWGKGQIPTNRERGMIAGASRDELDDNAPKTSAPPLSDRYARFYAALAKKARQVTPDAIVAGYAYSNYYQPPVADDIDLSGVVILHVPPMGSRGLWFPYTEQNSSDFRKSWEGWRRLGAELFFRPNTLHAGANLPAFYARQIADDFAFAAKHGMIGTYFDSLLGAWSAQGPTLYTVVRIHQHPDWPADKILQEYYAAFGTAQKAVEKYFRFWEEHAASLDPAQVSRFEQEEKGGGFQNYVRIAHHIFPPETFAQAAVFLEEARKAAGADPSTRRRIEYLSLGFRDAELTVAVRACQAKLEQIPDAANQDAFRIAFQNLQKHRLTMEKSGDHPANLGYFAMRETHGSNWPYLAGPSQQALKNETLFQQRWPEKSSANVQIDTLRLIKSVRLPANDWKFIKDSDRNLDLQKCYSTDFNCDSWKLVPIEKAWESFLGEPWIGAGWYCKELDIPSPEPDTEVFLAFSGVDESAWVWINGQYAGRHHIGPEGWEVAFRIHITPYLKPGKNLLTVRAMNTRFAGGIWRPVHIEFYQAKAK